MTGVPMPGGTISSKVLPFIWILDNTYPMGFNGKIQSLNQAMREFIPHLMDRACEYPEVQMVMQAIAFAKEAKWHMIQPTRIEDFRWNDLSTGSDQTNLGNALKLVAEQLKNVPRPSYPPVLILVLGRRLTVGDDFDIGLKALMEQRLGKQGVRLAIAVGDEADYDIMQNFIGSSEIKPLLAKNSYEILNYIRYILCSEDEPKLLSLSQDEPTNNHNERMIQVSNVRMPGGEIASRPLHFIWLLDCSGSMSYNGKIQGLNQAVREAIPHMVEVAGENPEAQVLTRVITFADGAKWHVSQPTPLEDFKWQDVQADGVTDLGRALKLVAEQLKMPPMPNRALPPVLVLVSDGQPTDDFNGGLKALMDEPWGKKAVRVAVAIGDDADYEVLQRFIGNPEIKPLPAKNVEELKRRIKWLSTTTIKAVSASVSKKDQDSFNQPTANVILPQPPPDDNTIDVAITDVF